MFEKLTKRVIHKVKDVATEEVKKSIEDSLPMYARLVVLGVLAIMMLWPTKNVIPLVTRIVFNTYNYY